MTLNHLGHVDRKNKCLEWADRQRSTPATSLQQANGKRSDLIRTGRQEEGDTATSVEQTDRKRSGALIYSQQFNRKRNAPATSFKKADGKRSTLLPL